MGETNDGVIGMFVEGVEIVVPAWEAVLIEWINAILPGVALVALLVFLMYLGQSGGKSPNIIGGRDDEQEG